MKENLTIEYQKEQRSKKVEAAIIYDDIKEIRKAIGISFASFQNDIGMLLDHLERERNISDKRYQRIIELNMENHMLRKQLGLKQREYEEKEIKNNPELDDVFTKLKELRKQKVEFEKKLDECFEYCQNQYDDLK